MSNEDELDEGLRRLFADDRLAIQPTPDAHRFIVAGAKRVRRRRDIALVGGGSLAAVLVLVGGMLVASPRFEGDQQAAAPHLTTSSPPAEEATSPSIPSPTKEKASQASPVPDSPDTSGQTRSNKEPTKQTSREETEAAEPETLETPMAAGYPLGPDGYGKLKLGMSFEQARETGMLADPDAPPPQGCTGYQLAEGQDFVYEVTISERDGLSVITATGARTPEGIGVGSSAEEVETAYPNHTKDESGYLVDTGSGGMYRLAITEGSAVEAFLLVRQEQDCGTY